MAIAPMDELRDTEVSLGSVHAALVRVAESLAGSGRMLPRSEAVRTLVGIEDISHVVDYLQVLGAGMAEERDLASGENARDVGSLPARAEQSLGGPGTDRAAGVKASDEAGGDDASGDRFRNCADYLRARLGISRAEAKRRLDLAHEVLPGITPSGAVVEPRAGAVGVAFASGTLSGRAATVICSAVERVRCLAVPEQLVSMEHQLTRQALESDEDVLRILARRWETVLDQDGQEPTEKVLRSRQGVFLRGRRNGLRILEIGATDDQYEQLMTAMTTATNPRTPVDRTAVDRTADDPGVGAAEASADGRGSGAPVDGRSGGASPTDRLADPTRAQRLLDGLVGACRIALSTSHLPATGGHRPQVMVTIDYRDLLGDGPGTTSPMGGEGTGQAVFGEQLSARAIRRIACDADLIPLVLGQEGQILDIGRAGRLFPPHLRRALVARDRGCAFPDCTIPASWCEAHHMTPWSRGGATSIDNGVLLCAHHHHAIHEGQWTVASHNGIPWFTPPPYLDRYGTTARRNRYWQAQPGIRDSAREERVREEGAGGEGRRGREREEE